MSLHPNEVLLAPVVSEQLFDVKVTNVNIVHVKAKPKRRNFIKGSRPGWKKAIVQVREGDTIDIFEGAQV